MKQYRIRVFTDKGQLVFQIPFETKEDWDNYWNSTMMTDAGLSMFRTYQNIMVQKEYLTQGGNWETELATPVEVSE